MGFRPLYLGGTGWALVAVAPWIPYAGYAGLGAGLLVAAAQAAGATLRNAVHVHVIAMGGFTLMIAATAPRLAALHPSGPVLLLMRGATLCWIAALALYLWRFTPWMLRPRPEHKPQVATVTPGQRT